MNYILDRLGETSTWAGLVWLLTAAGIAFSPEQSNAIVTAGATLAGAIRTFLPDRVAQQ